MNLPASWVIDIIGPAVLLIGLTWLVVRGRSSRSANNEEGSDEATLVHDRGEEQRRRDGADRL